MTMHYYDKYDKWDIERLSEAGKSRFTTGRRTHHKRARIMP